MSRLLVGLVGLVCACATRPAPPAGWRTQVAPTVKPDAVGEAASWVYRNEAGGRFNGWTWNSAPGQGHTYVYFRKLELCENSPEIHDLPIARVREGTGDTEFVELYTLSTGVAGVAVNLRPGTWWTGYGEGELRFERDNDHSLLILVEPWGYQRVAFYGQPRAIARARSRRQRMLARADAEAARCRERVPIGTSIGRVPPGVLVRHQ
jgi:hypothetical protein